MVGRRQEENLPRGRHVIGDQDTTHWYINESTEPFVFVAVDVFQPEKK